MTELPLCRWREHRVDGTLACHSEKFIAPPNRVDPDFCRSCRYCDPGPAEAPPFAWEPPRSDAAIAVATLYTPEIAEYGRLTSDVPAAYARRHGYNAAIVVARIDESRPPAWSKLVLVERYLSRNPSCEWIMWIDADAVVTNPAIRVEDLVDGDADFLVAEDCPPSPINTGVFLARNCPAVLDLLLRAYAKVQYLHHPWWEQPALGEALREGDGALRSRIVPRQRFNSFPGEHREGDFVVHYAGWSREAKAAGLRQAVVGARARE